MKKNRLNSYKDTQKALHDSINSTPEAMSVFFKTGIGDYAEFERFLGIKTASLRQIAKQCLHLSFDIIEQFLHSIFNEERLFALIILVMRYQKADVDTQKNIYQFYLKNIRYVNNWNLVDNSAHDIMGAYLWDKDRQILIQRAKSEDLWERRIAIVATWYFIKQQDFSYTTKIVEMLMRDQHDLIHKACGWMLREVGKQNNTILINFLDTYYACMPRTMLRYSIEKFPENKRKYYLLKK